MGSDVLVRVTFEGNVTGEYDLETTKRRFQKLFRLQKTQIERLFSGKSYTLKRNLSEAAAMYLAIKIAEAGCECSIESMPNENDLSQKPGFIEQRRIDDRRLKSRRPARPGAIVPDRRNNDGRRGIDNKD